jgi:hypothetical protein
MHPQRRGSKRETQKVISDGVIKDGYHNGNERARSAGGSSRLRSWHVWASELLATRCRNDHIGAEGQFQSPDSAQAGARGSKPRGRSALATPEGFPRRIFPPHQAPIERRYVHQHSHPTYLFSGFSPRITKSGTMGRIRRAPGAKSRFVAKRSSAPASPLSPPLRPDQIRPFKASGAGPHKIRQAVRNLRDRRPQAVARVDEDEDVLPPRGVRRRC